MKFLLKFIIIIFSFSILFSCNLKKDDDTNIVNTKKICGEDFLVFNENLNGTKIFAFKNQSEGQILSILIKTKNDRILVIDGGREADGEFLYNIIKSFGGVVDGWFITHIHDDHVGAIYDIIKNHDDIYIKNIYYQFPKFDDLYKIIGNDAGAVILVENQFAQYKLNKEKQNQFDAVNIFSSLTKNDIFSFDNIKIEVMNDMYLLEDDTLNNSSIVFKVFIKDNEKVIKTMMVLGDLAYEGGIRFLKDRGNDLKSDICVLAHHGQGGVWKDVYEKISPKTCIWPTTKKIYENKEKKYKTEVTKEWLEEIGVENNYITINNSILME